MTSTPPAGASPLPPAGAPGAGTGRTSGSGDHGPPIRMLHDRVLVSLDRDSAERRSATGIVIPATAVVGRRLSWGAVAAVGHHVRQVQVGDRVLFDPEERAEVELQGREYVLLRERDLHAVATPGDDRGQTGLYL